MKKLNYFAIYFLFFGVEYLLRTFVDAYKYHTVGLFFEFAPLIILTLVSTLICREKIIRGSFFKSFFNIFSVSVLGFLSAKIILFFQCYWIIAPEYRNVPGDFSEGLSWTIFFAIVGILVILISYLILVYVIKNKTKK